MTRLVLSILPLLIGPILYRLGRDRGRPLALLDGLVFVGMSGVIFLGTLPHAMEFGGGWCIPLVFIGAILPGLTERYVHTIHRGAHRVALALGLLGFLTHAVLDGWALVDPGDSGGGGHLPLAVYLHRVPVGLTIWWLVRRRWGFAAAASLVGAVAGATAFGYFFGGHLSDGLSSRGVAWFQAFVAGMLLHVVLHRVGEPPEAIAHTDPVLRRRWEAIGGLVGLGLLAVLFGFAGDAHSHTGPHGEGAHAEGEHGSAAEEVFHTFLDLALESAPALVIGFSLAGLLGVFLADGAIRWLGGGTLWGRAFRGVAIGLPLPVCSCGVVPIYRALVRRAAPGGSALAFLVATPELGVDAVLLSIPLLGVEFTIVRVVAAVLVALLIGVILGRGADPKAPPDEGETPVPRRRRGWRGATVESLRVGFIETVDHTGPWILAGIVIAAFVAPVLADIDLEGIAGTPLEVLAFALLGIPIYVCASGATPLVAVLLAHGVSPGASLAFLLTGPATNVTTYGVLAALHGRRLALAFGALALTLASLAGLATNAWLSPLLPAAAEAEHEHHEPSVVAIACLSLLAVLFLWSLLRRGPRAFVGEIFRVPGDAWEPGSDGAHDHADGGHCSGRGDGPAAPDQHRSCCH